MLTRVHKRFLKYLGTGLGIMATSIAVSIAFVEGYKYLGFDREESSALGLASVLILAVIGYTIELAWRKAKWDIEYETRKVEEALKGK